MDNFVALFCAILENAKVFTEDEAKKLTKDLQGITIPDSYTSASRLVKDLFEKHEIKNLEQKVVKLTKKV